MTCRTRLRISEHHSTNARSIESHVLDIHVDHRDCICSTQIGRHKGLASCFQDGTMDRHNSRFSVSYRFGLEMDFLKAGTLSLDQRRQF